MLYYTILYYTILYYTILYYTILHNAILYILYYTILYYTTLYYTILYYTKLYYTTLYYSILHYFVRNMWMIALLNTTVNGDVYLKIIKFFNWFLKTRDVVHERWYSKFCSSQFYYKLRKFFLTKPSWVLVVNVCKRLMKHIWYSVVFNCKDKICETGKSLFYEYLKFSASQSFQLYFWQCHYLLF